MAGRGVFKRNRKGNTIHSNSGQKNTASVDADENSPIIKIFRECQLQLDAKHDKYERLVKLSRDITIESKRTIFQLHRISGSSQPESVLSETEEKLQEIQDAHWRLVALELNEEDPYQFLRAYSPGLQEYIEALSFWYYLKNKDLIGLQEVEDRLKFSKDISIVTEPKGDLQLEVSLHSATNSTPMFEDVKKASDIHVAVHIPPVEYILGIADLTGELMRMAINSVGLGDFTLPFELCSFMRIIYDAFVLFGNIQRDLPRKLNVLRASVKKVETACYTLQVRGSEIPKHMLKDVFKVVQTDRNDVEECLE